MVLRLPGTGAPTIGAPSPTEGIGERPPSTTPAGVGAERGAACAAGAGAGCNAGAAGGGAAGRDADAVPAGARPSAALRFPNTYTYSTTLDSGRHARLRNFSSSGDNRL